MTLPDVVTLLLQNNQELKNAALERIVQRQELRQAESAFSPQFQPLLGIGMSQTLSDGGFAGGAPLNSSSVGGFGGSMSGGSDRLSNGTVITRGAQVAGQLRTPLGTSLSVTVNPFESQRIGVTVTQPLLRGVGARVNQAPVNQARLTEEQNQWALQQRISEQITEAGVAYRALARAQEALRIEQASLEQQQQELNFVQVLVDAGRRARSELVQVRANIATTETRVLTAQNALEQAKSNLLNLLDLEESLAIAIPPELIAEFQTGEIPAAQYAAMQVEQLLPAAYENRPEYQQALLAIEVAKQGQIIAQDNQRWGLDVQARMGVGDTSDVAAGVTLTRRFGDESLNTEQQRSEVTLQQRQNDLTRITEEIRLEVGDRLRDVNSALARITAAQQATQLAEQRLEIATERFRRGRDGDLFQVLSLQNDIVLARNEEVNAKIDFLDAVSRLDQARGLTLGSWRSQIEASGLLRE
ncbi:MAG: TolC family protein [Oculatellaceae cyanobacterium Prado106]|nr:TolC family protein [Oculatellaceae cyanobacterium Prado106]